MQLSRNYKQVAFKGLIVLTFVLFLDQFVKLFLLHKVGMNNTMQLFPGIVQLNLVKNTGGAFSILQDYPMVFKLIGVVNILIFSYISFCPTVKLNNMVKIGSSFILGGTAGNLIDRFFRSGVIDFIDLQFFNFAIFNFADVCVDIGVALILIGILFNKSAVQKS